MAVSEQTPYIEYTANGVTTSFALEFDCDKQDHLIVLVDDVEPVVGAWSFSNGAVVFNTAPESGKKITIQRNTPLQRNTDYQSYDNSFRPLAVNNDFDRVWYKIQELGVKDWLLDLKIQKFRDDVNLTALENTLEEAKQIRDDTADSVVEVQSNVAQSQALLGNTTAQANLAQGYASSANSANAAAQQAAIDVSTAKSDVYSALSAQQTAVNNSLTAIAGGHKAYQTLAAAQAAQATLPVNSIVEVTNDGANNGTYQWNGTTLTKSPYDPLTQAKNYTDTSLNSFKADLTAPSKNLFNPATKVTGKFISNDPAGVIQNLAGWSISDYIPVTAGLSYAISATQRRVGLAFYDSAKVLVAGSYNQTNPAIVTAPVGAAYLVINVDSDTITASKVQVEQSTTVTSYVEFDELIKDSKIGENIVRTDELMEFVAKTELEGLVEPLTIKDYDIIVTSPNLYDSTKKQVGKLVNSDNGRITSLAGWSCSDFIPVVAGQYYTISYEAKRVGLAFYSTKESAATTSLGYVNSLSNPLTVQAPVGANWLVTNADSTSIVSSKVQVESGSVATPYQEYGTHFKIDPAYINDFGGNSKSKLEIKAANIAAVSGFVDGVPIKINLQLTKANTHDNSTVFNFTSDAVNNVIQRAYATDDVAPMRLDGYTIGANHGYEKSNVTLVSHGKTAVDIGSVWSSAGKEYVIVDIVSVDVLSVTSRTDNIPFALGTLTHVSGATNTASFTPTATTSNQWFPSIRDRKLTCFVDNVKIDLAQIANYDFEKNVKFLESYSILKKSDMLDWLIANKGVNHTNYNAVPLYTVNFAYTFDTECGCTIYFGGVGRKTAVLQDQMIAQSIQLDQGNGVVYNYIPKSTEFTDGGYTYNFSQLENLYSKNPSTRLFLTAARQEAGTSPIDRLVMLNDQVGYAIGYLPILDAAPNVRPTNAARKYLEIRNGTLKVYPSLIDSALINQINDGDAFAAIAYRKYFKRSPDRTCKYVVRSEMGDYLYLDWHAAKTDEIELPADLVGCEFEIFEKSSNVTLLSKFASNSILVKIDNSKTYGYLVLKFK